MPRAHLRDDIRATLQLAAQGKLRCRIETAALDDINKIFDPLCDDPRFQDLLRRMNLPE